MNETNIIQHLGGYHHHPGDLLSVRLSAAAPEILVMGAMCDQPYFPHRQRNLQGDEE